MNPFTDIWHQLVRRRLWPVAILLVAALAAVPVLLAKEPVPPAPVPAPVMAGGEDDTLASEPIVALATEKADAHRKPLGKRRDIFKSTKKPTPKKAEKTQEEKPEPATGGPAPANDPAAPDTGGGYTDPAPVQPPEQPKEEPKKTYAADSLVVRFSAGDDAGKDVLERRSALPSADSPLVIYLGLEDDGKTAVFMLDASLTAIGDGECDPSPESCETLRMREGDTMFLDAVDETGTSAQYQLDLVKINAKRAKSARTAKVAAVSSGLGARNR